MFIKSKGVRSGSAFCLGCGHIREWVGGCFPGEADCALPQHLSISVRKE